METWRIEKMIPVKQEDPLCNGKLYQGDSYIFLSTTMKGSAMVWHIHFWLGEETSQVLRIGPPLSCTPFRSLIIYSFVYGLSLCDLNMMTPLLSSLDTMRRALHHTLKSLSSSNTYTQSNQSPPSPSPRLLFPLPLKGRIRGGGVQDGGAGRVPGWGARAAPRVPGARVGALHVLLQEGRPRVPARWHRLGLQQGA